MEDTAWERLAEERDMSGLDNQIDWATAPEGTMFFSAFCFRKHVNGDEYYWEDGIDDDWVLDAYESIGIHQREYHDFQMRPCLNIDWFKDPIIPKERMDEILADAMVAANKVVVDVPVQTGAIKSDGGSSSYYDIQLPNWLIDLIIERRYIKTEELIEVLGSDFDLGNIIKCAVRINSLQNGFGKAGNDVTYDSNKIIYSAGRLKERDKR